MTTPVLARHYRNRWLREARRARDLAADATTPEDQARWRAEVRQCVRNAWEAHRRMRGYGVAQMLSTELIAA